MKNGETHFQTWWKLVNSETILPSLDQAIQEFKVLRKDNEQHIKPNPEGLFEIFRRIKFDSLNYVFITKRISDLPYDSYFNQVIYTSLGLEGSKELSAFYESKGVLILPLCFSSDNRDTLENTHLNIWLEFTQNMISTIHNIKPDVKFVLFGNQANQLRELFRKNADVTNIVHPDYYLSKKVKTYAGTKLLWKKLKWIDRL